MEGSEQRKMGIESQLRSHWLFKECLGSKTYRNYNREWGKIEYREWEKKGSRTDSQNYSLSSLLDYGAIKWILK